MAPLVIVPDPASMLLFVVVMVPLAVNEPVKLAALLIVWPLIKPLVMVLLPSAKAPVEVMAPLANVPTPLMLPLESSTKLGVLMKLVKPVVAPMLMPFTVPLAAAARLRRLEVLAPEVAAAAFSVSDSPFTATVPEPLLFLNVMLVRFSLLVAKEVSVSATASVEELLVEVMAVVPNPVNAIEPEVPVRFSAPVVKVNPLDAVKVEATDSVPVNAAEELMVCPLTVPEV